MAVDRPPSASVLTLTLTSGLFFGRWQWALWESGKRGFIAFSAFPSGRFSFLFLLLFFFVEKCRFPRLFRRFAPFERR
jgi:hypothetical protein